MTRDGALPIAWAEQAGGGRILGTKRPHWSLGPTSEAGSRRSPSPRWTETDRADTGSIGELSCVCGVPRHRLSPLSQVHVRNILMAMENQQ